MLGERYLIMVLRLRNRFNLGHHYCQISMHLPRLQRTLLLLAFASLFSLFIVRNYVIHFNKNGAKIYPHQETRENGEFFKTILLWTPWFGDPAWSELFILLNNESSLLSFNNDDNNDNQIAVDKRRCRLTYNRSFVSEADLLVFHGRDYDENDLPALSARQMRQIYVFFSMEAPPMVFSDYKWSIVDAELTFNWTASYSSQADVRFNYGRIIRHNFANEQIDEASNKITQFVNGFASRKKDAIWLVSHCETDSAREQLVQKLKELGVTIDIFGDCGDNEAPAWNPNHQIFADYRYYLSFENSLCDDYVTEKLFRGLKLSITQGLIPLAYGGAVDYAKLGVPEQSFIQMRDYLPGNLTKLAHFLTKELPYDSETLGGYFKWQLRNKFGLNTFPYSWRRLCEKLWQHDDQKPQTIANVRSTFGACVSPEL